MYYRYTTLNITFNLTLQTSDGDIAAIVQITTCNVAIKILYESHTCTT